MGFPPLQVQIPNFGLPAYSPPNWSQVNTTSILVPATSAAGPTLLVFDVVARLEHRQEVTKTSHPIQTGANITDHSYIEPARVVLEVGMSDAVASYQAGMWSGSPSKSISAYQALLAIQKSRIVVQVTTRLRTYSNMLIRTLSPIDTAETRHGLRAAVVFEEVLLASVTGTSQNSSGLVFSERPQATDQSSAGTVQDTAPSDALTEQNNVTDWAPAEDYPYVPGGGNWSSNPLSSLPINP